MLFALSVSAGTCGPETIHRRQRLIDSTLGLSETPLPERLKPTSLGQLPTLGATSGGQRSISSQVYPLQTFKEAVSVLRISDEAEALVSRIVSENMPKATTTRLLSRRR